ncbi:hypothetical protein HRbin01_01770 [archaeon HR01]|nr:hypothetical protein HRbin01_01770 [archaeon HR01]
MVVKTLLFGIDGGTWSVIRPLIEDGALPHFGEVVSDGVSGILKSSIPYTTLPGWTSMFTGVNPGKHGIIENIIRVNGEFVICNSSYRMVETIWQTLYRKGYGTIVVNDPATYPPDNIGIHITGLLTPWTAQDYVHPINLKKEIEQVSGGYIPDIQTSYYANLRKDKDVAFRQVSEYAQKIKRVGIHLLQNYEWKMAAVIFTSTDRLQHFYWNQTEYIRRHYTEIDSYLGEFMNLASKEQANILITSDHGFTHVKEFFYVNAFLHNKGLLKPMKEGLATSSMRRMGVTRSRIVEMLRKHKTLYRLAKRLAPAKLKKSVPLSDRLRVNPRDSKVYAITNLGLFVNSLSGEELSSLLRELASVKSSDGVPFIKEVFPRDEVIWGPYADRAPDIVILPNEGYKIRNELYLDMRLTSKPYYADYDITPTGEHAIDGIILAHGPDIAKGRQIETKRIWDIAPTILHMAGLAIPDYFDGRVIKDLYATGSPLYSRTVSVVRRGARERILDRIREIKAKNMV